MDVSFTAEGAQIACLNGAGLIRARVNDAHGRLILDTGELEESRRTWRFIFDWREGQSYAFSGSDDEGREFQIQRAAPSRRVFRSDLQLFFPLLGWETEETAFVASASRTVSIVAGVTANVALGVQNTSPLPLEGKVDLYLPSELHPVQLMAKEPISLTPRLNRMGERWLWNVPIPIPQDGTWTVKAHASWRQGDEVWENDYTLLVNPQSAADFAGQVAFAGVEFPCDRFGKPLEGRRADSFILPANSWLRLRQLLGLPGEVSNAWTPAGYQAVTLTHRGETSAGYVIESQTIDERTRQPIPELAPPALLSGGGQSSRGFVYLRPNETATVPIPVYIDTARILPGMYLRTIQIKPWGADTVLVEVERSMEIFRPSGISAGVVFGAVLLALGLLVCLVWYGPQVLQSFTTRELTLIALFATILFAAVSLPLAIVSNFFVVFMGPLASLITGLANKLIYHALLIAFWVLVPRVGAAAMLIGVRILLAAIVLGQISVPELVSASVHIVALEIAGYLTGLTRGGVLSRVAMGEKRGLWGPAFALGVSSAITTWIDFQISMELLRLFFAKWYIALDMLVNGFLYTVIGVRIGARLGCALGRTAP